MTRNGRGGEQDPEISVVCRGCEAAIHVAIDAYVDGADVTCPECRETLDLDEVDDDVPPAEVLRDRIPAEARTRATLPLSEFPTPG